MTMSSLDEAQIDFLPAGPTTTISSGPSLFQENARFNLSDPDLVEAWHIYNVFRNKFFYLKIKIKFASFLALAIKARILCLDLL